MQLFQLRAAQTKSVRRRAIVKTGTNGEIEINVQVGIECERGRWQRQIRRARGQSGYGEFTIAKHRIQKVGQVQIGQMNAASGRVCCRTVLFCFVRFAIVHIVEHLMLIAEYQRQNRCIRKARNPSERAKQTDEDGNKQTARFVRVDIDHQ